MSTDEERTRIGTTRGDQPVEDVARAGVAEGEQAREDELAADREQIGTTRGGQPVESLRDGDPSVVEGDARDEEAEAGQGTT